MIWDSIYNQCEVCESTGDEGTPVAIVDRIWTDDMAVDEGILVCKKHLEQEDGMFSIVNVRMLS